MAIREYSCSLLRDRGFTTRCKVSAYDQRMQWRQVLYYLHSQTALDFSLYFSLYFSSEGVQVGGIASATGVVGAWTGARHEPSPFSLSCTHKLTLIYFHRGSCW